MTEPTEKLAIIVPVILGLLVLCWLGGKYIEWLVKNDYDNAFTVMGPIFLIIGIAWYLIL